MPQWSPLSTSGATVPTVIGKDSASNAAMEPALDERGDLGDGGDVAEQVGAGRNGARSRRAGRPLHLEALSRLVVIAAMEPALDERGDLG